MNKKVKRLVAFLCCVLSVFSATTTLSACNTEQTKHDGYVETNIPFIKDGSSDYKILIADEALDREIFAATELQYFLEEATDFKMPIVTQNELTENAKFISVGYTEQLKKSSIKTEQGELGASGYRIMSQGENVYLFGADDGRGEGTIYSAYGFLNAMIDYVYYSDATIYYKETDLVNVKNFNLTKVPRFDVRDINTMKSHNDITYRYRMGLTSKDNYAQIVTGHAFFKVLPPATYYSAHPDWYYYNESKQQATQLCLSNEEMRKEFAKNFLEMVQAEAEDATMFSLGISDNLDYCDCSNCKKALETYGTYGGLYIDFCNEITDVTDEWFAQNQPGREVEYEAQIYYFTEPAPVEKNENGEYEAVHPDVIPKSNLRLMYAPIGTRIRNKVIDDEVNQAVYETYKAWGALSDNIRSYNYACSYYQHGYMYAINDFVNVEKDLEFYEEIGVKEAYYTFGYRTTDTACLYDMKAYCLSQLMWGTEKSYQELAKDFMEHSYLEASEPLWNFYEDYRMHMLTCEAEYPSKNTGSTNRIMNDVLFPKVFVDKLQGYINQAYKAIEKYKTEASIIYEELRSKINKEEIMVLYVYLQVYQNSFSLENRKDMIERLSEYAYQHNVIRSGENWLLVDYLDKWKAELNK